MAKGIEKNNREVLCANCCLLGQSTKRWIWQNSFDPPIEIQCRWEDKNEIDVGWISTGFPGNIRLSKSSVLVTQDLDEKGYLWLGSLDEVKALYPTDYNNPERIF